MPVKRWAKITKISFQPLHKFFKLIINIVLFNNTKKCNSGFDFKLIVFYNGTDCECIA